MGRESPTTPAAGPPSVLSFGGGVNSVALLLRLVREGTPPDLVLFADTGEEAPETYRYIEDRIRPFCAERGLPFEVVTSGLGRMVDYYAAKGAIPSMMRRDCTSKFKVDPIARRLRALGYGPKKPVRMLVGLAADETHRVNRHSARAAAWRRQEYPLHDLFKMDRAACEAEIAAHGWPSPGKSGCRGCPFAGRKGLLALREQDPDDFDRWRRMEETARALNPRMNLLGSGRTIPTLNRLVGHPEEGERALDFWQGGDCMAGACPP